MKKLLILSCLFLVASATHAQQRFAYIDTKYILDKVPEYTAAEKEVDQQSQVWQKELDDMYANIQKLYDKYKAEEVLLSETVKKQHQDEIVQAENAAKNYQKKRFGYEGDLFKLRNEKVKPVQDKVFKAVEDVAKERHASFVFDKAGAVVLLYTDPAYDYSDYVLAKLGITK